MTGIGHQTALLLDSLGFTVFAGCLNTESEGAIELMSSLSSQAHLVHLDVTKDENVARVVDYVSKNCGSQGKRLALIMQ